MQECSSRYKFRCTLKRNAEIIRRGVKGAALINAIARSTRTERRRNDDLKIRGFLISTRRRGDTFTITHGSRGNERAGVGTTGKSEPRSLRGPTALFYYRARVFAQKVIEKKEAGAAIIVN